MTSPTPTPPCLGEREAVARTEELTEKIAVWLKEANSGWWESTCLLLASDLLNGPLATLRTENETLRAERDAAIARAEEAARGRAVIGAAIPPTIERLRSERDAMHVRLADRTAKLAQAEGKIATMRSALKLAENPLSYRNANGHGAPGSHAVATALAAVRAALTTPEPPHGD